MKAALILIFAAALLALVLGVRARSGHRMDLEQWTVGGRGFGTVLVFLLLAGEIYTTFTFLGGSGWAYGRGAPTYYILAYGSLAYVLSYWLLPAIWRYGKQERLHTQPDFFARKYRSRTLGVLVALIGAVALVPYLQLQFKGLAIIVSAASYGAIPPALAVWIGAAIVTAYVVVSGVRGSAWTAVVKDALILLVVLFLGLYLPWHYYGGLGAMFRAVDAAKPGFLTLAPGSMILIGAASLLANNIVREAWPRMSEDRVSLLARVLVPLLALLTVFLTLRGGTTIVQLLLMGYSLVTQLFPSLLASLMRRNPVTAPGAIAGVLVGVAAVAVLTLSRATVASLFPFLPPALQDLNVGIVALVLNVIALAVVSALTRGMAAARMQPAGE